MLFAHRKRMPLPYNVHRRRDEGISEPRGGYTITLRQTRYTDATIS